jgi:O-antigen/teichoic acid export membrane protein
MLLRPIHRSAIMLTRKTIFGAAWTVSSRLAGRLIDFVTVLVLARALTPADFGLTALAMTLTVVVDMVLDIPLIQALTRLPDVKKSHLDTAFTLGALRGLVLAVVVLVAAWPFAHVYNDPRLLPLVAVTAIGPIARSLYSPAMVKHIRQMSFREVFVAEILGKIVASAIAIGAVSAGGGYWAIVASGVSAPIAATSFSYLLAPYRPALSLSEFADFSTFLGWLSSAQIVVALSWQFDRMLLGYFLDKSELGRYTMASDLSVLPTQSLIGPAMQPVMAAFSRINDNRERLRNAYSKASRLTMLLAAPACIGMSLTSDLIVNVLLGAKWQEAAIYLQWLALSTVLNAFYQPLHSLALATNRTSLVFRLSLVELCSKILLMSLGFYFYSVIGVVAARGTVSLILFVLSLVAARHLIGTNAASEAANLWRVAAACAVMTILALWLRHGLGAMHLAAPLELAMISIFGSAVYIGSLLALGMRLKSYVAAV